MIKKDNNRIVSLDVARAFCVLWIVGFWHMMGYWSDDFLLGEVSGYFAQIITWSTLSAFTFFSGYFLGKKNISGMKGVLIFYKQRFKRFYILYLLSCISLYCAGLLVSSNGVGQLWFPNVKSLLLTLLGVSSFSSLQPATLWYISMLMFFYLITPFLLLLRKDGYKALISIMIFIGLIVASKLTTIDNRIIMYFPFYVIGMLCPYVIFEKIIASKWYIKMLILLFFVCAVIIQNYTQSSYLFYLTSLLGILIISFIGDLLSKTKLEKILCGIGYASMAAYLFHRQICGFFKVLFGGEISILMSYLVVIPIVFILSYFIQWGYDRIINKIMS